LLGTWQDLSGMWLTFAQSTNIRNYNYAQTMPERALYISH